MVGKTISHYKVLEKIGQGGMGEVYRATDTKLNRDVALKILPEQFTQDPQRLARFEREAKLLASLNHPKITALYGLEVCRQIGEGVEAAHEKSVIHRDNTIAGEGQTSPITVIVNCTAELSEGDRN